MANKDYTSLPYFADDVIILAQCDPAGLTVRERVGPPRMFWGLVHKWWENVASDGLEFCGFFGEASAVMQAFYWTTAVKRERGRKATL